MIRPRIAFVIEQALGHVAYGAALRTALADRDDFDPIWIDVPFEPAGLGRLPIVRRNWTLRGSLEARRRILSAQRTGRIDAMFLHTQTIALFAGSLMRRIPTLLSLDATPANLDELADYYGHQVGGRRIEALKRRLVKNAMSHAAHYTTWSSWTKASLAGDYGVDSGAITVIHPGATLGNFTPAKRAHDGKLRLLFVGGDFERKGGDLLLAVFDRSLRDSCELHIVTAADVSQSEGVFVHRGLRPHSDDLLRLYSECDVLVLPTRGDCLAVVLGEAMAASMPIITTDVGAHAEAVEHGASGYIIKSEDVSALQDHLLTLAADRQLVTRMGHRAREIGEQRFDMAKGASLVADMLIRLARGASSSTTIVDQEPAPHRGRA